MNELKEIPKDTIAEWFKEAQKSSMDNYNRIDSRYCEMYLQLKTEGWRIAERNKDTTNELILEFSELKKIDNELITLYKERISQLELQIKQLKMQIK